MRHALSKGMAQGESRAGTRRPLPRHRREDMDSRLRGNDEIRPAAMRQLQPLNLISKFISFIARPA